MSSEDLEKGKKVKIKTTLLPYFVLLLLYFLKDEVESENKKCW